MGGSPAFLKRQSRSPHGHSITSAFKISSAEPQVQLGLQVRCLSLFGKSLVALTSGLYRDDLICHNLILLPQALQANRKLELSETAIK